jgi:hypothetical protein
MPTLEPAGEIRREFEPQPGDIVAQEHPFIRMKSATSRGLKACLGYTKVALSVRCSYVGGWYNARHHGKKQADADNSDPIKRATVKYCRLKLTTFALCDMAASELA